MDFRVKVALQHAFSVVPGGRKLNYLMQRYVSRSLPASDETLDVLRGIAKRHVEDHGRPRSILDFGCGWDLVLPILMAQASGAKVVAADIEDGVSQFLVNDALRRLGYKSLADAGVTFRVFDMREAPYADGAFDVITTTSVLEHIPADHLPQVMRECRRLLAPGGVCSFHVAYRDHWSHFDGRLPHMNYLRFSDAEWKAYNPALQYQNRLLHSDYVRIFKDAGFSIECEKTTYVGSVPIAERFAGHPDEDFTTTHGWFVLHATG